MSETSESARAIPAPDRAREGPRSALRWRRTALRVFVSALLLGVLATLLNQRELWGHLRSFLEHSGDVWGGALALFCGMHVLGALKWRVFLRLAGARISVLQALRFYGAGLFANLCLPSLIGGDLVRAGLAMAACEEKEAVVLGSIVDRLVDLVGLVVLVGIGAVASAGALERLAEGSIHPGAILLGFLAILAAGVVCAVLVLRPKVLARLPAKLARSLGEVRRAFGALRTRPVPALGATLLSLTVQSGFVLVNADIGSAMGIALDLDLWFLLWPLAKIAAMVPFSLGGLGVREAAFAALTGPFGVPSELAVAQSLVWQTVLIAGGLVYGLFAVLTGTRIRPAPPEDARG